MADQTIEIVSFNHVPASVSLVYDDVTLNVLEISVVNGGDHSLRVIAGIVGQPLLTISRTFDPHSIVSRALPLGYRLVDAGDIWYLECPNSRRLWYGSDIWMRVSYPA